MMKRIEIHTDRTTLICLVKKLNKISGEEWKCKLSSKGMVLTKLQETNTNTDRQS